MSSHPNTEEKLRLYCGQNNVFQKGRVGCGDFFEEWEEPYRCIDCDVKFHKQCLRTHCISDLDNFKKLLDEKESRIRWLETQIKDLKEKLNDHAPF